jgi:hypothetical protein
MFDMQTNQNIYYTSIDLKTHLYITLNDNNVRSKLEIKLT